MRKRCAGLYARPARRRRNRRLPVRMPANVWPARARSARLPPAQTLTSDRPVRQSSAGRPRNSATASAANAGARRGRSHAPVPPAAPGPHRTASPAHPSSPQCRMAAQNAFPANAPAGAQLQPEAAGRRRFHRTMPANICLSCACRAGSSFRFKDRLIQYLHRLVAQRLVGAGGNAIAAWRCERRGCQT